MKKLLKWMCIPLIAIFCCQSVAAAGLMETVVTSPALVKVNHYLVSVIPHADGSVDYFTLLMPDTAPAELRRYHSGDGGKNWTEIPCKWAIPVAKQYGRYEERMVLTEDIDLDENGNCYFAVPDGDNVNHMIEAKPDGTYRELPISTWKKGHKAMEVLNQQTTADTFTCAYFMMNGEAYVEQLDRKTGALKQTIEDSGQSYDVSFAGDTALMGGMSDFLTFYDLKSGKRLRDVKLPHTSGSYGSGEMAVTLDEKGAAYVAGKHGLERLAPGGSMFETILAGDRCYLGDQTCALREMRKQPGADVIYIVLSIDGQDRLCRYAVS